ncbi:MAG: hypothetical protein AAFO07_03490, partial [Bacteroidota bacterium]
KALDNILPSEYLRQMYDQEEVMTFHDWWTVLKEPGGITWTDTFLKENFRDEIRNIYFAELFAFMLTLGMHTEDKFDHLKQTCTEEHILNRIIHYHDLVEYGMEDGTYPLFSEDLVLNEPKFNELLDQHKGKPLYIIFWNAQYAGSHLIGNLPEVKAFEKKNKEKLQVINISIDMEKHKGLWAARIIDNAWNSAHYFMPIEGNESTLNKLSSKTIASFCNGAATYTFIDENGNIIDSNAKSPMELVSEDIEEYLK